MARNLIARLAFGSVGLRTRGCLVIPGLVLGVGLSGTAIAQTNVTLPDSNLEAMVRGALSLSNSTNALTVADLQLLTCLSACNRQIANLWGLQYASNLTGLYLNGNAIRDLTPLRGLNQLRSLELKNNNITYLWPLAALTNLSCLALGGNYPSDYSTLSNLTSLSSLSVNGGAMQDLTVLQGLRGLSSLSLWQNNIQELSPLAALTNLSRLDLRWNAITNCAPLYALTNLSSLYLGGNSLSNVPCLKSLTRLSLLNLDQDEISDVSPLTNLTSLTYLSLNVNQATNLGVLSNLTGLVNLELRDNSISNLAFLSSLFRLGYADLAYNNITNLSPLIGLSNLNALVLAGNPLTNYTPLLQLTSVSNLWLFSSALSNADFVTNLVWLNYLNLEQNSITNLSLLPALRHLTGLALSHNPIADYGNLVNSTNLTSLRLEGESITNLAFLTNLTRLGFLSLSHNQITDLSPLAALTNLQNLYLQRNVLRDIQPLTNGFPHLLNIDLSLNSLDLGSNSTAPSVIQGLQWRTTGVFQCACTLGTNVTQGLQCQRVQVDYLPTNQPPSISANLTLPGRWYISSNSTSSLTLYASEDPPPGDANLVVAASSSKASLVQIVKSPLPGTNYSRTLTVTAGYNPLTNTATITLTATDDVGLSSSTDILVTVVVPLPFSDLQGRGVTNLEQNLEAAIRAASGNYEDDLSSVDLLNLNGLYVYDADLIGFTGWQWLTNLATLYLANSSITNVDFLTNLTQLVSLSLAGNQISDTSPLAGLTNLAYLNLTGNSISNVEFLTNLTQLTSLELEDNRITDISPLSALTNLNSLNMQQNLLTNVSSLTNLTQLQTVDVSVNLLDLSDNSSTAAVIQQLQDQGATVSDQPQREPPIITAPAFWFVSTNSTSSLSFTVTDNAVYGSQFSVQAVSSATNLVPNESVLVSGPDTYGNWTLTINPAANETGNANVTLLATSDAGLSSEDTIQVSVLVPQVDDIPDTNLLWAILTMLGDPGEYVTDVNLLNLTELDAYGAGISELSGLQGASNLTTLQLDGNSISDLGPLAKLTQLTSLSLSNNFVTDISPLAGLTNLTYLNVSENFITNYEPFISGFRNLTSLDLGGNSISNLDFLTNLTQLVTLGLEGNWISNLSPLASLTNLGSLDLQDNLVTNILPLTNLARLWFVDLSFNLLDLSEDSPAMAGIQAMQGQAVTVYYLPQNELLDDQFFGTSNLAWQMGGSAPWFGQTNVSWNGVAAAESGAIGNNRESWIEATVTGPGLLSFWWKVSSETNSDFLTFYMDTNEQARISGEVDWQPQVYSVWPGVHTLLWDYSKDLATSCGLDAGWLAHVVFQPGMLLELAAGPTNVKVTALGVPVAYQIQVSTNLVDWESLAVVTTNSVGSFDTGPATGCHFYRAMVANLQTEVRLELAGNRTNLQLNLLGVPGTAFQLQVSTNLVDWEALAIVRTNSIVSFDTGPATGTRFYRAMAANLPAVSQPPQLPTVKSGVP